MTPDTNVTLVPGDLLQLSLFTNESVSKLNIYVCWNCYFIKKYANSIFVFQEEIITQDDRKINTYCFACKEKMAFTYDLDVINPYTKVKYILI